MINIDFSPNSIQDIYNNTSQVISYADDIERSSLPTHEDIEKDLDSAKRDIDNYAKSIDQEAKEIKSGLSLILDRDFDYKFHLFVQLASQGLTEESFPITDWLSEKQKLDESFSVRNFNALDSAIKSCENQDIKNTLLSEYLYIIKECLNSPTSFKYMTGQSFVKELNCIINENKKDKNNIYQYFKNPLYTKETGNKSTPSQANFWQIYDLLKNIENSTEETIIFLKQIPENKVEDFVTFLVKTDFIFKKNYRNTIEGFNKEPLRNIVGILNDKEIRNVFLPQFINSLNNLKEKSYLKNEDKDMFEFVLKELDKAGQYLTLSNKFVKKEEKTKTIKI